MLAAAIVLLIALVLVELSPASWWRAAPRGDGHDVDIAIIMGFGYVGAPSGGMRPGAANTFLFDWVRERYPGVKTMLVQEGVWAAACDTARTECNQGDVTLLRMHCHQPGLDVNTLQAVECAVLELKRLRSPERRKVLLAAHHLQLWRVARCFEKVRAGHCLECEPVVPDIPDVPYVPDSVQWRTRYEWLYRLSELGARVRDLGPFAPTPDGECIAPAPHENDEADSGRAATRGRT